MVTRLVDISAEDLPGRNVGVLRHLSVAYAVILMQENLKENFQVSKG